MNLPTPRQLVENTEAASTAKLFCYLRLSSPVPEACDLRGEGGVEFQRNRSWLSESLLTERMGREKDQGRRRLSGPVLRLIYRAYARALGTGKVVLFEGGAVREREADGTWGMPLGSVDGPKYPRHPLCIFQPLSRAVRMERVENLDGPVRDAEADCFRVDLTDSEVDSPVWNEIQGRTDNSSEEVLPVFVWVGRCGRIRRVAFEGSRKYASKAPLWSITELSDFGCTFAIPGAEHE